MIVNLVAYFFGPPCILLKIKLFFGLHFCRRQYEPIFKHLYVIGLKPEEFGRITQNNGRYIVQGHSRSPILALVESPYETSY